MAQFGRPTDDITVSNWTGDPINTAGNRYQNVDETVSSEVDFCSWVSGGNELILGLGSLVDPVLSSDHVLRVRYKEAGNIYLRQASTVIASGTATASGYNDIVITLSSGEADAITDYTDLNIRFQGTGVSGARVAWAEFEVPNADPVYEQSDFRARNDDGSESAATWIASGNVNWTQDADVNFRLRFVSKCTINGGTVLRSWEYNLASGGWNDITGSSSVVQLVDSSHFATNDDTTQQLGSGTLVTDNNGMREKTGLPTGYTSVAGEEVELEFCLTIIGTDVTDGQTLQIRLKGVDTYTNTPTITVNEFPVYEQSDFRGRNDDGSESGATWKRAVNTNFTQVEDENFRLRFLLQTTIGNGGSTLFIFEYNRNGAGWNDVTSSSSVLRTVDSSNFAQNDDTTQQIGSGTFTSDNNAMREATDAIASMTSPVDEEWEFEGCFQLVGSDVGNGDTIQIRAKGLDTYTVTPTITVGATLQLTDQSALSNLTGRLSRRKLGPQGLVS